MAFEDDKEKWLGMGRFMKSLKTSFMKEDLEAYLINVCDLRKL